ncbi:calmodulin-like protein 4 [Amphiura filiformis]|uniref:calmodulin-like protein 4 n=1 Tax=Amphiura filiformis TaxID=82378 RepID=UPI003B2139CF
MAHVFSQKQIDEYKECFSLYDRSERRDGIRGEDLIVVMRSLGSYPTIEEIKDYRKQYEHGGKIKFNDFLMVMNNQLKTEDAQKEILEAFRMSDKQKMGSIPVAELKNTMTRFGEQISEREVDSLLRELGIQKKAGIPYKEFVAQVLNPIPDTLP